MRRPVPRRHRTLRRPAGGGCLPHINRRPVVLKMKRVPSSKACCRPNAIPAIEPAPIMSSPASTETPASTERFNVVILYEQRAFVDRAMSTYFHLKRELGNNQETDLRIWRIGVATWPVFAAQADRDIERADVIIVAVRGGQPFPPAFQRWKTGAGSGLGRPHGAVITLAEVAGEPTPSVETWTSVLRTCTTQIHPGVFVWDPPTECSEAATETIANRQAPLRADALAGN